MCIARRWWRGMMSFSRIFRARGGRVLLRGGEGGMSSAVWFMGRKGRGKGGIGVFWLGLAGQVERKSMHERRGSAAA